MPWNLIQLSVLFHVSVLFINICFGREHLEEVQCNKFQDAKISLELMNPLRSFKFKIQKLILSAHIKYIFIQHKKKCITAHRKAQGNEFSLMWGRLWHIVLLLKYILVRWWFAFSTPILLLLLTKDHIYHILTIMQHTLVTFVYRLKRFLIMFRSSISRGYSTKRCVIWLRILLTRKNT